MKNINSFYKRGNLEIEHENISDVICTAEGQKKKKKMRNISQNA